MPLTPSQPVQVEEGAARRCSRFQAPRVTSRVSRTPMPLTIGIPSSSMNRSYGLFGGR